MATLKNTTINNSSAIQLPVGTTAQRPVSASDGYMRFNSSLNIVEYSSNGSWSYLPDIVRDGLVLYLDAANPECFSQGATSCVNLVSGGFVTGASGTPGAGVHSPNPGNFPSYNSQNGGVFDFSGGKGMNCEENLGYRTETTLIIYFYKTSSATEYFSDARNNGGQWFLSNYTNDNINYTEALTYNFNGSYDAANPNFLNKWFYMAVTSDNTSSKLYLNGQLITGGSRTSIDEDFGVNFRIGTRYTTSSQWTGLMGPILAYSRVLSAAEIQQNFNVFKGRFGL